MDKERGQLSLLALQLEVDKVQRSLVVGHTHGQVAVGVEVPWWLALQWEVDKEQKRSLVVDKVQKRLLVVDHTQGLVPDMEEFLLEGRELAMARRLVLVEPGRMAHILLQLLELHILCKVQ